jgi:arsenate reductase
MPIFPLLTALALLGVHLNTTTVNQTTSPTMMESKTEFYPELQQYIAAELLPAMEQISPERRAQLEEIAEYVREQRQAGEAVHLVFICTHNSRRSHFGQIWAAAAAAYYGIPSVSTYSGGTEATAFNPRAVAAIQRAGFQVENPGGNNPRYQVRYAASAPALECWSKTYDDPANPRRSFAAIMTCAEADQACPIVPGADLRSPIPYVDPKEADDTPQETARYDERCRQIGAELFYLFSKAAAGF